MGRPPRRFWRRFTCGAIAAGLTCVQPALAQSELVQVPAFTLPQSSFLPSRKATPQVPESTPPCPSAEQVPVAQMPAVRECEAQAFYKSAAYRRLYAQYPVVMTRRRIGGVDTEVFEPRAGVSPRNARRVLINVHGGAFRGGARTISHLEAVPIASVGRFKVISIDYRMAPEYRFPAASEDVEAVYRELLKTYKPGNIGIYGCSAGGLLTAESVARLLSRHIPVPGAIGMLCEGGAYWTEGDSGHLGKALGWDADDTIATNGYFRDVSADDPLAFPARSDALLAQFPASLLISSTRDVALSSVVFTHSRLVALGVDAQLHVWEGLGHAFFGDPTLPQSREAYAVIARFFDRHLGT